MAHYQEINENIFCDGSEAKAYDSHTLPDENSCLLNYNMGVECSICSDKCTNRTIQTKSFLDDVIELFDAGKKEKGVRTKVFIACGSLITEFLGEVRTIANFKKMLQNEYISERHHYGLEIGGGLMIDAYRKGSLSRYLNHSCQANCAFIQVRVDGFPRMILKAAVDIAAGD